MIRQSFTGSVCLVTQTGYGRDWINRNMVGRVVDLWSKYDPAGRRLKVKSKAEFDGEEPQAASLAPTSDSAAPAEPAEVVEIADRARPGRSGLQERLTFDSFVSGHGNAFALAMAREIGKWTDGHFTPVFFHGPYGFGKTHLLNAIAWEAQRLRPDAKVVYLTAERFLTTFVRAIRDRATQEFKDSLRTADMLLIDDVQFVAGKAVSQEELLYTLTALIEDNRRVVLSADRAPSLLTDVDARLRSHLGSGLVCAVEPADRALRLGIVERKLKALAQRQPVDLPAKPEVVQFLADRVPGSIRELEGALNTLVAGAGSRLARLTLEEAQDPAAPEPARRRRAADHRGRDPEDHRRPLRPQTIGPAVRAAHPRGDPPAADRHVPLQAADHPLLPRHRPAVRRARPHHRHPRGEADRGADGDRRTDRPRHGVPDAGKLPMARVRDKTLGTGPSRAPFPSPQRGSSRASPTAVFRYSAPPSTDQDA